MSAASDLREALLPDETVEAIVFGPWGWGSAPIEGAEWEPGYGEPDPSPVPFELRGKVLTWEQAEPLMQSWNFYGGYGSPTCYSVRIWTSSRVLWVTEYDGSTRLNSAPRNPVAEMPDMPGGG